MLEFGNLKEVAAQAKATRNGACAGNYRSKLVSIYFEKDDTGRTIMVSEWIHLSVYGANPGSTLEDCLKCVNKKVKINVYLTGKGSEFGRIKMASIMEEILKGSPYNLEDYKTETDFTTLFMQLNAHTIIRELAGKYGTNKKFLNWYVKRDRPQDGAAPAPAPLSAAASPAAGNMTWADTKPAEAPATPAPAPAPAPEPVKEQAPTPAPAPQSAASALFG